MELLENQLSGEPGQEQDFHTVNAAIRQVYVNACQHLNDPYGDHEAARTVRDLAAEVFVRMNARLAFNGARPFLHGDYTDDHEAAALMGLWEAFVGTDAELAGTVDVDDSGRVVAQSGWDPESGTFGTWSRAFITGRAARSVAALEPRFHGVSYTAFQKAPAVRKAWQELRDAGEKFPSDAQVAERAGVTVDVVHAVRSGAPTSLDAMVSSDSSDTLADVLLKSPEILREGDADDATRHVIAVAGQLSVMDLLVGAARFGLHGLPAKSVVETADLLLIGRGAANNATRRLEAALSAGPVTAQE